MGKSSGSGFNSNIQKGIGYVLGKGNFWAPRGKNKVVGLIPLHCQLALVQWAAKPPLVLGGSIRDYIFST